MPNDPPESRGDSKPPRGAFVFRLGGAARIAAAFVSVLLACAGAGAQETKPKAPPRPANRANSDRCADRLVLDLRIERVPDEERYRVVDIRGARVVAAGSWDECAAARSRELVRRHGVGRPNLPIRTLGGAQLWADRFVRRGWRIQEHVHFGHFRLLDAGNVRRAWGSFAACRTSFEREARERDLCPRSDHLVVLVHGLGRTRGMFRQFEEALAAAGYETAAVGYPSTRRSIDDHADGIERVLDAASEIREVSFVTHSLGGIVVRELLARPAAWRQRIQTHRLVMLGPPNQGSVIANRLESFPIFRALAGPSGPELTPDEVDARPVPDCEFGIIAGGTGGRGYNPFLLGDNDGVVRVDNTRLPGARDFCVLPVGHTFMASEPEVIRRTLHFLQNGRFPRKTKESAAAESAPDAPADGGSSPPTEPSTNETP